MDTCLTKLEPRRTLAPPRILLRTSFATNTAAAISAAPLNSALPATISGRSAKGQTRASSPAILASTAMFRKPTRRQRSSRSLPPRYLPTCHAKTARNPKGFSPFIIFMPSLYICTIICLVQRYLERRLSPPTVPLCVTTGYI